MNVQPSVANLADFLASPANAGPVLRLLAGAILDAQLGKTVPAVVQQSNGNQATLTVQGKQVLVETPVRLEAGAALFLKVVGTGSQPRLEVQSQKLPDQRDVPRTTPNASPPSELQRAITATIAPSTTPSAPASTPAPSPASATVLWLSIRKPHTIQRASSPRADTGCCWPWT
jgi:hypothetical protein